MEIQNQVSRILRDNLARLRDVLDEATAAGVGSLVQVADRVCEAFDFRDGRDRWQRASCCRALSDLQAAGHVSLPAGRGARGGGGRARVLPHPLAPAVDVPGTVGEVVGLTLELVETDEQRQVWNTLMAYEHPRGAGPFVGPQLRYLVGSAHGWLGGVGFAASARRLRSRDAWVGWDDAGRRAHLHRVLGLCRLLVRPGIVCRNLASHVLGRVVRTVGDDCEGLYGYRPWLLETFVDETEQTGASVRAANWVRVGETCGRGRQDRTHAAPETRKAVYMYALEPAWHTRLAVPAPVVAPLAVGDGLDAAVWAEHEFGGARLGDARLSARLVQSAQHMAESPMRAITGAAHGARAMVKGHYRLIDQPADSAVTVGNILAPHREQTLRRMQAHDTVLWCARLTGEGQPVEVRRKEGVTNHFRPESCAGRCEAAGEALTGARTGRAIEHRKRERLERRDCHSGRRQHRHHRNGEGMAGSTVSENPCTFVRPSSGPGRSSFCPGSRTGAAAGRRIPYPMMHGMKKSDEAIVCARQRNGQEGSSPSGPRMRGAVSKGGGNASPAAGGRYGDTYTGTQAKAGHSQGGPGAPTTELRRTGRPSRGGVRRVCGAVPGRSRGGDPMTNRSAKGGARSSLHYGGEGALIHPPHQGVCGRHGTEDQCVTLGDLGGSAGGTAATDPISESEVGRDARRGVGRPSST